MPFWRVLPARPATYVADLARSSSTVNRRRRRAAVTASVEDRSGSPVAGATVVGSWSEGASGTGSCTTDAGGSCAITSGNIWIWDNQVRFTVGDVTAEGYLYDEASNAETSIPVYR